jgi:hypothetical protein
VHYQIKAAGGIRLGDHHSCGLYANGGSFDTTTRKHCKRDAFLTSYTFHLLFLQVWNLSSLLKERAATAGTLRAECWGKEETRKTLSCPCLHHTDILGEHMYSSTPFKPLH